MSTDIESGQLVAWTYQQHLMAGSVIRLTTLNGTPCAIIDPLQSVFAITKPIRDLRPFLAAKGTEGRS